MVVKGINLKYKVKIVCNVVYNDVYKRKYFFIRIRYILKYINILWYIIENDIFCNKVEIKL